jgi:5-methylthioadenosine/S-adenosylhomocysteine deaminase
LENKKKIADKLLVNGRIITVDKENRIFKKGAVAIKGGDIIGVGKSEELLINFESGEIIDLKGAVVHPGLINCHNHLAHSLFRCWFPDNKNLTDYFNTDIENIFFKNISKEMEYYATMLSCMEMVMTGTTSFMSINSDLGYLESQIEAVEDIGIRGTVSQSIKDVRSKFPSTTKECLEKLEYNLKNYGYKPGRKAYCVSTVYGIENGSNELMMGAKSLAEKYNTILNTHCSWSEDDVDICKRENNGKTPTEVYNELGILDEKTTLVHMNVLSDVDLKIIYKTKINPVRCPEILMRLGFGYSKISKYPEMLKAGVNAAIGTDCGQVSSNHADLTKAMYTEALMEKEGRNDLNIISAEDVLNMATIFGAKAMGIQDKAGSIEVGKWADLVIHRIDRPESYPNNYLVRNLVYSMGSKTIKDVMVGGEFIVKDSKLNTGDAETILEKVESLSGKIREIIPLLEQDKQM